jgi:hypothetical protein
MSHPDDPRSSATSSSEILSALEACRKGWGSHSYVVALYIIGLCGFLAWSFPGEAFWLICAALIVAVGIGMVVLAALRSRWSLSLALLFWAFFKVGSSARPSIKWIGWPGICLVGSGLVFGSLFPGPVTGAMLPIGLLLLWLAQLLFHIEKVRSALVRADGE